MKKVISKEAVSVQTIFASIQKKAAPILKRIEKAPKINSPATLDVLGAELKTLKLVAKEAEDQLASIVDPIKQSIKNAQAIWKPFLTGIYTVIDDKKLDISEYKTAQDRASMKVLKDFEEGKIKKTGTVIAKQAELAVASDNVSFRKLIRAKCINASLTPREYLLPDERAILEALKAGKKVKGWEIETINSIAI